MKHKRLITCAILFLVIPLIVILGALIFKGKYYSWISLCVAVVSCLPLFYAFEHRENTASELNVLAALIAISALSRLIFSFVPGFKPITALTVIAAVWLGKESGFVVGALSAVVSNIYFGQGPWTPFQMFAWGGIGFLAGLFGKRLRTNKILLCIFGVLSGVLYSLAMDVWTTVWADGGFNISRYLTSAVLAIPTTFEYAISNVIFLLLLSKPFGDKLSRIKIKYGLFSVNESERNLK